MCGSVLPWIVPNPVSPLWKWSCCTVQPDQSWAAAELTTLGEYEQPPFSGFSWINASQFLICFWSVSRILSGFLDFFSFSSVITVWWGWEFADLLASPECYPHRLLVEYVFLCMPSPDTCLFLFARVGLYVVRCKGHLPCQHIGITWEAFQIPVPKLHPRTLHQNH